LLGKGRDKFFGRRWDLYFIEGVFSDNLFVDQPGVETSKTA
jgi:hypothetical protein